VRRIVVGVSGASGTIYGVRLVRELIRAGVETHLVVTRAARRVGDLELPGGIEEAESLADAVYGDDDFAAPPASGTFRCDGMVVAPCSVKTLSGVANSYAEGLLVRAADCMLKERRRLVLVVRETPLHEGHLRLMTRATRLGGIILPPVPGFYTRPRSVDDVVNHTVGKILGLFGIEHDLYRPWEGGMIDPRGGDHTGDA